MTGEGPPRESIGQEKPSVGELSEKKSHFREDQFPAAGQEGRKRVSTVREQR